MSKEPCYWRGVHLTLGMRKGIRAMQAGVPAAYPTIAGGPRVRLFDAKMLRLAKGSKDMMELTSLGIEAREYLDMAGGV